MDFNVKEKRYCKLNFQYIAIGCTQRLKNTNTTFAQCNEFIIKHIILLQCLCRINYPKDLLMLAKMKN